MEAVKDCHGAGGIREARDALIKFSRKMNGREGSTRALSPFSSSVKQKGCLRP